MEYVIETPRLGLRRLCRADFSALCGILQDIDVMYAWEHAFSDDEVYAWIDKNLSRYETDGFSYFAAIDKESGTLIGMIGPLMEEVDGASRVGVGYILAKQHWGKGYAAEGARACVDYAFATLGATSVIAEIRPENAASRKVARRLGMAVQGEFVKHYRGKEMPHLIYCVTK